MICSFAIVEGMIGISHTNVHLVRDFLNSFLMMGALCFSSKALELSLKPQDEDYNFGYRRYNILAAFVNCVYLMFSFLFNFVDNLHHIVEHWEFDQHLNDTAIQTEHNHIVQHQHDDVQHMKEMNQYLGLFTFLRLCVLGFYLYFEARH